MQIKKVEELKDKTEELKEKAEELLRKEIFWQAVLGFLLAFLFLILLALSQT